MLQFVIETVFPAKGFGQGIRGAACEDRHCQDPHRNNAYGKQRTGGATGEWSKSLSRDIS